MKNKMLSLCFPCICLHCGNETEPDHLFCEECSFLFDLIDRNHRCPYCFCEMEVRKPCHKCIEQKRWGYQVGSALINRGAVSTLTKRLKHEKSSFLMKSAADFMAIQLHRFNWRIDYLVDPENLFERLFFGKNWLTREVGAILNIPVITSRAQRKIEDKNVCVITLVLDLDRYDPFMQKILSYCPQKAYLFALSTKKN